MAWKDGKVEIWLETGDGELTITGDAGRYVVARNGKEIAARYVGIKMDMRDGPSIEVEEMCASPDGKAGERHDNPRAGGLSTRS